MSAQTALPANNQYVVSYMLLRQMIGALGLGMPIFVHGWAKIFYGIPLANSISAYYYTVMRDEFVSTLVLVGVLLLCYRGPSRIDNAIASIAGIAGIGIALSPMSQASACEILGKFSNVCQLPPSTHPSYHFIFVAIFFALVFVLVFFRFRLPTPGAPAARKNARNKVYFACGIAMLVSFLIIGLMNLTHNEGSIFWPETVAVMAFAIAWLTKGQAILKG
ncbi:hypothetical protein SAMN05216319_2187 [Duganella sp. CF402]|uniref:hypothetical protein n=1 Tax=unclassified Duganella TaxID=2636909 RepID=UPI0008B840B2|nr:MULTISPECIES: hypothetical protein [unclassified Duganella]RZT09386.1 hypothetical protein EV582_1434 [Duganella sp. BK701]SEL59357.1 hypothetical protein SAMN05216319_2187 [Duganella sp. CF402]